MYSRTLLKVHASQDYLSIIKQQKLNNKVTIAQVAPSVRAAIHEPFNCNPIKPTQIVSSLKKIGFDYVFDTCFSADVTIMEEGTEFITRFSQGDLIDLPMITSCCPGWVQLVETSYPELLPRLSTTKSPQQIMGALVKNYFSQKINTSPENVFMMSVMPCVRKQGEADKEHINSIQNIKDVDLVITTNDLVSILKTENNDLCNIHETEWDNPMGNSSGGAVIFGRSGGVMLAALRFAYEKLTGEKLIHVDMTPNSEFPFLTEAVIKINDIEIKIAVIKGLGDAKKYIRALYDGKVKHHFVEVMACVDACISGAGNPPVGKNKDLIQQRKDIINNLDERSKEKVCSDVSDINVLYKEFLGEPNSGKAHDLLHTHHEPKTKHE